MAATVRETMLEMLASTVQTLERLLAAPEDALALESSHVCAQGRDTWTLLTNLIDHESQHLGEVIEARYEEKAPRTPMERLAGEWLEVRARFLAGLIGLSDKRFNDPAEPGGWSFREIAEHVAGLERHAQKTMTADGALQPK
jgi:hypothetical protein